MAYRTLDIETAGLEVYGDPDVDFYGLHIVYTSGEESVYIGSEDDSWAAVEDTEDRLDVKSCEVVQIG